MRTCSVFVRLAGEPCSRSDPACQKAHEKSESHIRVPCVAQENGVGKRFGSGYRANWAGYRAKGIHSLPLRLPPLPKVALLALALTACATPTVTRSCLTQQQYEQLKA